MNTPGKEQGEDGNGYFKGNIDARVNLLEENVRDIKINHLPHIQKSIDNLQLTIEQRHDITQRWLIALLTSTIFMFAALLLNLLTKK